MIVDLWLFIKRGSLSVINRTLPTTILISSFYWCIFELLNVRIENWFYINLPEERGERYLGYFFAYGTVIPAITLLKEAISDLLNLRPRMWRISLRNYPSYAVAFGTSTFFLILLYPTYFFPFTWISPLLVLDGINYRIGQHSFFKEIEKGEYKNVVSTLISGLICGILWEFWNFWAQAKWVYTVPFFEGFKVFEMPLLGYLGFSFFALETLAFKDFIEWVKGRAKKTTIVISLLVCIVTFPIIDRYTVFSYRSGIDELYFLERWKIESLKAKGKKTSLGVEETVLSQEEKKRLELMHLYGLGVKNLMKLDKKGIDSVDKLSRLTEEELSLIIGERNMRRVRVYLNEARRITLSREGP